MQATKDLSTKERLVFATADMWGGGGQTLISVLYLVYLTNILRVHPAVAGTALMIAKIWDAIIDPVFGVLVDNTRTRWGRRRPYMIFGAAILLLAMAVLWWPVSFDSDLAHGVYITLTNMFYATIASLISIAYSAMSTEISTSFDEINKVNVNRLLFSMSATALTSLLPTTFFKYLQNGTWSLKSFYLVIVLGFGLAFTVPIFVAGLYCKERVTYDAAPTQISFRGLIDPLQLKPFRQLLGLYLSQTVTMDVLSAIIIYYGLYVVKGVNATIFLGLFLAIQLIMLPVYYYLVKTISKTKLYRQGLPIAIVAAMGIGFYPNEWPVIGVYILTAIAAFAFSGAASLTWIIFPDIVDIGEVVDGKRSTGAFSATMTFIRQLSSAGTIFVIGHLLGFSGFITPTDDLPLPDQPSSTVWVIRFIFAFTFLICGINGWRVSKRLSLTPGESIKIKQWLKAKPHDLSPGQEQVTTESWNASDYQAFHDKIVNKYQA